MKADLHCHTKLSDGTMGIDDILVLAKNSGVTTLAITDHDCLAGTVRASIIGKRYGVEVIPAVEFSATDMKRRSKAHILCYLPDKPERLEGLCKLNSERRLKSAKMMASKVASRYPVSIDFIMKCCTGSTNIYKQHIMKAFMESGYTTSIYGDIYKTLFSSESESCVSVATVYPEPAKIVAAIHEAGGIAVLAHPGFYNNFELLEELIPLGLDGVEVWHPENSPEEQEKLIKIAKKHGLVMTGGSDFHGGFNAYPVKLGDYGPNEEALNQLLTYKAKKRRKQKKLAAATE